ncbi:MAG: hypothetical protein KA419_12500 [Acidobacteria bacterium]|nr:hypothetical protein [Acidobacteriota bacterium]
MTGVADTPFAPADILPSRDAVTALLGVPPGRGGGRLERLLDEALAVLADLATPAGLRRAVEAGEFARIYPGEGRNVSPSPLESVLPGARRLALFVITLGEGVSRRIGELFERGDPASGAVLDAAASAAAERAADALEAGWAASWSSPGDGLVTRRYSPGYCGWDLTGQRALLAAVEAGRIGVSLNASCLMSPLKSISGVMVAGPAGIHRYRRVFPCCAGCPGAGCRAEP